MHSKKVRASIAHVAHPIATDDRHRNATWTGYKREQPIVQITITYYSDALNKRHLGNAQARKPPHIKICTTDAWEPTSTTEHRTQQAPNTQRGAGSKLAYLCTGTYTQQSETSPTSLVDSKLCIARQQGDSLLQAAAYEQEWLQSQKPC